MSQRSDVCKSEVPSTETLTLLCHILKLTRGMSGNKVALLNCEDGIVALTAHSKSIISHIQVRKTPLETLRGFTLFEDLFRNWCASLSLKAGTVHCKIVQEIYDCVPLFKQSLSSSKRHLFWPVPCEDKQFSRDLLNSKVAVISKSQFDIWIRE